MRSPDPVLSWLDLVYTSFTLMHEDASWGRRKPLPIHLIRLIKAYSWQGRIVQLSIQLLVNALRNKLQQITLYINGRIRNCLISTQCHSLVGDVGRLNATILTFLFDSHVQWFDIDVTYDINSWLVARTVRITCSKWHWHINTQWNLHASTNKDMSTLLHFNQNAIEHKSKKIQTNSSYNN